MLSTEHCANCRSKATGNNKKNKKGRREEIKARQQKTAESTKARSAAPSLVPPCCCCNHVSVVPSPHALTAEAACNQPAITSALPLLKGDKYVWVEMAAANTLSVGCVRE